MLSASWMCAVGLATAVRGQGTQPIVAIHDSELTRALETTAASGATPKGTGTTGYQWWPTNWHYFVLTESAKEALRSDGSSFTVVGDSNITAGVLVTNNVPRYPILISLASEAIDNNEITQLTNYVARGGFLLVGSSAFTRNTNGTTRGDFAFANAMGVHMVVPGLTNWTGNSTNTKTTNHRLVVDLPSGPLTWRMPSTSEEISWGISPSHPFLAPHDLWKVQVDSGAVVLTTGDSYPFLVVKPYGKGYFIYHAAFQPLIGHGGWAPGMYAYMIFRRAIEWAFESANLPIPKLSPWPYPYDAALMVRHDMENYTNAIAAIETSAGFEYTNGVKGDYYFCTGTVRDDAPNKTTIITGLRRAVTNYNATIGPHNGGAKNPNNTSLVRGQYDYWHWGPDEALGVGGGKTYAFTSISNSLKDIEGWLSGTGNGSGLRTWVSPYFNATREDSYDIQAGLNVKITGDQKLTPFPHWTVSTKTADKRYALLSEPVSDWFVGGLVAQSLEPWHPPGVHNSETMHSAVDFYYNLGALINIYSHTLSTGLGDAGPLVADYITYSMNTNFHPRVWAANGVGVYQWWLQRSNAQINATFATNGNQRIATVTIRGATHINTAVEILVPGTNALCNIQVLTNGTLAGANTYQTNWQTIRVKVGTGVTNAVLSYYLLGSSGQVFSESLDGVSAPALPAGWSTSASGAQGNWVTQTSVRDTAPNAAYSSAATSVGINELISPPMTLPAGSSQLSFRNNYNLESDSGGVGYDGGVLEIKIGTNAYKDVVTAGGTFVGGGYNSRISGLYSNVLGGRLAWSGSSGGFISTLLNLPASASGQTIQLRWRCATDNGGPSGSGWYIDTVAVTSQVCSCCGSTNTAPVLPGQANRTIVALTTLVVTNTATDADLPAQALSYQLIAPPTWADIDAKGVITWTPASTQAPSTNLIKTVVTDNGTPPLSATNTFTVVVTPGNNPPVLPAQPNRTTAELTTLFVTNTATDTDMPAQALSYQLIAPPTGASIATNGLITWTPAESLGPGAYTLTTVVTDNGTPPLSATNSLTVTVTEVNAAPTLPAQANRTVAEFTTLVVTNTATDADIPANTLTYALVAAPPGATLSPGGVITWSPTETQGPSTNLFTTVVTDNGTPPLSATNGFTVTVTEVNRAPALAAQTNRTILELTALLVTNTATDADLPANVLTYSLVTPPAGAVIDTNGVIAWTPTEAQAPSTNLITTVVTDNGAPPLSATNIFTVFVTTTNSAPVLPTQADRTIAELATLVVTNTASDADIPANTLAYTLVGAPAGATISPGGVITWTPTEAQGPGTYALTTVVTDNGIPPLSATNVFLVALTEVNTAPVLPAQTNRTILELTALVVTNTATDSDIPANLLTYSLVNPPAGAVIGTNGVFVWTPSAAQGPGTNLITTMVADSGNPSLSATNSFTVVVVDTNGPPGQLFADDFARSIDPGPLSPWVAQSGTWTVTGGLLRGGKNGTQTYTHAYLTNNWTNYSVQAQFKFPSGAAGAGVGGFLNRTTGSHYAAWIYPENSPGGSQVLKLLKFQNWTTWGYNGSNSVPMQQVSLPSVGTTWHTLTLGLSNSQITVSFDSNQVIRVTDTEALPYTSGGVCVSMWTASTRYFLSVDNVVVTSLTTSTNFFSPPPAPEIESIALDQIGFVINWTAETGRTYRLQFTESLAAAAWNDVFPDVLASGATVTVTNSIGNAPQRFYRVLLVQ